MYLGHIPSFQGQCRTHRLVSKGLPSREGGIPLPGKKKKTFLCSIMGGRKKKNCSGCGTQHKGPWGPFKCPYLLGKSPGRGSETSTSEPGTPAGGAGAGGSPPGGGDGSRTPPRDNSAYIQELEDKIAYLTDFNKRRDEETRIMELERRLQELQVSSLRQQPVEGGRSAAGGVPGFDPSQLIGVHTQSGGRPGVRLPTFGIQDPGFTQSPIPDGKDRRNSKFRPEFYLDTNKPVDKLTYREFLYGCLCVADTLVQEGWPVSGYINHLRFIAWKAAMGGAYQTQALIRYDQQPPKSSQGSCQTGLLVTTRLVAYI